MAICVTNRIPKRAGHWLIWSEFIDWLGAGITKKMTIHIHESNEVRDTHMSLIILSSVQIFSDVWTHESGTAPRLKVPMKYTQGTPHVDWIVSVEFIYLSLYIYTFVARRWYILTKMQNWAKMQRHISNRAPMKIVYFYVYVLHCSLASRKCETCQLRRLAGLDWLAWLRFQNYQTSVRICIWIIKPPCG